MFTYISVTLVCQSDPTICLASVSYIFLSGILISEDVPLIRVSTP